MQTALTLLRQAQDAQPWFRARLGSSSSAGTLLCWLAAAGRMLIPTPEPELVPVPVRRPRLVPGAVAIMFGALIVSNASVAMAEWYEPETRYGSRAHEFADGSLVDVKVQVDGEITPLFFKPGTSDRHYFQAFKKRNYALVVRNNTGRRVGVLIAVDGLNVVNGERSGLARQEPMYVLDPYESATIRGWRTSLHEVRRFVFVDEERSYAERTGQANGDMGWIRVLAFREAGSTPWVSPNRGWDDRFKEELGSRQPLRGDESKSGYRDTAPRAQAAPAPESVAPPKDARAFDGQSYERNESSPGTGWGERKHDTVRETHFEPARRAADHLVFRYEYARGLQALGINPWGDRTWERERGELGFAQPPRR